uniref:Uncharacterized protein n=1 Tax=Oryza brachyantha TaxID=4533 RepID=J3KZ64_ORYBR
MLRCFVLTYVMFIRKVYVLFRRLRGSWEAESRGQAVDAWPKVRPKEGVSKLLVFVEARGDRTMSMCHRIGLDLSGKI